MAKENVDLNKAITILIEEGEFTFYKVAKLFRKQKRAIELKYKKFGHKYSKKSNKKYNSHSSHEVCASCHICKHTCYQNYATKLYNFYKKNDWTMAFHIVDRDDLRGKSFF